MKDKTEKLPGRREAALAALLSSPTVRDAAKACGLSEPTLYRYLREPAFFERVREARRALIGNLETRLQAKAEGAAKILGDIAEDEGKPASVLVSAARIIIESALKVHEHAETAREPPWEYGAEFTEESITTVSMNCPRCGRPFVVNVVQDFRLHDLRHTCATLLLAVGEHPKVVSERPGHASITLTLDVYSHVLPTMQESASRKLESLLDGKTGTSS